MGFTLSFFDGQGHRDVANDNPYPVKIMEDVQSANITGTTKQVVVSETLVTLIADANPNRRSILLTQKTGAQIVYYGFNTSVSATTGGYIAAAAGSSVTLTAKGAIYGLSITAAQTLAVVEESYESE
jgi:hypothetical protein